MWMYLVEGLCSMGSSMVVQASLAFLVPLWKGQALPLVRNQALPASGHLLVPPSRSNSVSGQHLLQCASGPLLLDVQWSCKIHTHNVVSWTVLGVDVVDFVDVLKRRPWEVLRDCWLEYFWEVLQDCLLEYSSSGIDFASCCVWLHTSHEIHNQMTGSCSFGMEDLWRLKL